jgi:lipoyl(octanoyl) transferase
VLSATSYTLASLVSARPLAVRELGTIGYRECWDLQNQLAHAVGGRTATETLLLLEHPHTYTCGRQGGRDHILLPDAELAVRRITVLDVDRGGDVTYHGPGQLVVYPIIDLHAYGKQINYSGYVRALEEVLIGTLADFAISATRLEGYSGVWVGGNDGPEKIAAIGVRVDAKGITTHGIALNVNTDLSYFEGIIPCGIKSRGVTSMRRLLKRSPTVEEVGASFSSHFRSVFGFGAS